MSLAVPFKSFLSPKPAVQSPLSALRQELATNLAVVETCAASLASSANALPELLSNAEWQAAAVWDEVMRAVEEVGRCLRAQAPLCEKALEAQEDAACVASDQLAAAAAQGHAALASSDPLCIALALECAASCARLAAKRRVLTSPTVVDAIAATGAVVRAAASGSGVWGRIVDFARLTADGPGMHAFQSGEEPCAQNTVVVTIPRLDAGPAAAWLGSAGEPSLPLCARVTAGYEPCPSSVTPTLLGVRVSYVVPHPRALPVDIQLFLYGREVWQRKGIPRGFMGTVGCVRTLRLPSLPRRGNAGIAISHAGTHIAVSNAESHELFVFTLPDGELVSRMGCMGAGPRAFEHPYRIAWTVEDTLVVADHKNERVQELTREGALVQILGEGVIKSTVFGIAVHGDTVAVGKSKGDEEADRILLFSRASGNLVARFGRHGYIPGSLNFVDGLRFTPDGTHLLVASNEPVRISRYSVTGRFERDLTETAFSNAWVDVDLGVGGHFVVTDPHDNCVRMFGPGGELVHSWHASDPVSGTPFQYPIGLAVLGPTLYILDYCSNVISLYE